MTLFNWLARRFNNRGNRKPRRGRTLSPRAFRLQMEPLEDRSMLAGFIAVGTDAGVPAEVRIFADRDDNDTYETSVSSSTPAPFTFSPYPGFTGGVRVAMGDFDGDGNDELVTGAGPGGGPHVIVWDLNADGTVGGVVDSFMAFGSFTGGVFVAAGNLNGGADELAVAPDAGGGAHVKIYSDTDTDSLLNDNLTDEFFAFSGFTGGVRLAFGNTHNTSGVEELICAAGPGGGPHVLIFSDSDVDRQVSDNPVIDSFFVYAATFSGGVYVASTPIPAMGGNGAELITGAGAGGGPDVRIFSDVNGNGSVSDDSIAEGFFAYAAGFSGGVRVAAGDTDNSASTDGISGGFGELITGPGPGGGPHIMIRDDNGDVGGLIGDNPPADQFFAYPASYSAGVFVAFGKVQVGVAANQFQQVIAEGTTNFRLQVEPGAGIIRDLDLTFGILHTNNEELDVTLTHVASGTSVELWTDVGGTRRGFIIRLDDESALDLGSVSGTGTDAVMGIFNPEGTALLSAFDALDASGEWRLTIADDTANAFNGQLLGWSLHFSY
jgi:hypothetical protein